MAMSDHAAHAAPAVPLARIVERARAEHMPAPAIVQPPGAPNLFGPPNGDTWTLTTQTQNRPQGRKIRYDPMTRPEVARSGFADNKRGRAPCRERVCTYVYISGVSLTL